MLKPQQVKDHLTKFEINTYAIISYVATALFFLTAYFSLNINDDIISFALSIICFLSLSVLGVFGLAIKHDTRVLDLRKFDD